MPDDAEAPAGWTKWTVPAFEYLCVKVEAQDTFTKTLAYMQENHIPLAGAVQDFTDPEEGANYMFSRRSVCEGTEKEAPVIETPRLIPQGKAGMRYSRYAGPFNNEEVRRCLGGYPPREERAMWRMVRDRKTTEWAVTLRETGIYIGECQLFDITDHYLGELGYYFRREYWGAGYAYEAAEAVCNYAGDVLKLGRLCANVDTANERSKRLLERLGFCSWRCCRKQTSAAE